MVSASVIAFRVDASVEIGSGHVMRCLTLARALHEGGQEILFISRALPGNLNAHIRQQDFEVIELPAPGPCDSGRSPAAHAVWLGVDWQQDARQSAEALRDLSPDWLILDHYALDAAWQEQVLPSGCRLMVIDDLADRPHRADLLLDQNLGRSADDYAALVPADCTVLVGPRYALLRPEFAKLRAETLARRQQEPSLRNILVFMGGMDKDNATGAVLSALPACPLSEGLRVTVVMGSRSPALEAVRVQCVDLPFAAELCVDASNMAELMSRADLAIGAAGSSSWERCCLGLPTIILALAENQAGIHGALVAADAAISIEWNTAVALTEQLSPALERVKDNLSGMVRTASALCDGHGADRVNAAIRQSSDEGAPCVED